MNILKSLILVAVAVLYFTHGDPGNTMKVLKANCIAYALTEILDVKCYATAVNRSYSVAHAYFYLNRTYNNIFIHFQLHKKTDVKYRPFLVNTKEDYCGFFKNNQASAYLKFIYQMYAPYSNLNHSCPYSGQVIIKDCPMDGRLLPSLWPAGEYRLDVNVLHFDVKKITMQFYFEVKELKKKLQKY